MQRKDNNIKDNKINVVVKYFYPVSAGIELNSLEVYSNLAKMGWDVTIHTTRDTLNEKGILKSREKYKGLTIIRHKTLGFYLLSNAYFTKSNIICLHNFNVLPHFTILLISAIYKLLGIKKYKLFLIPHGGYTPEWSIFSKVTAYFKSNYHFKIGKFLINYAVDKIRAVSEWESKEIIKFGINKNKIRVIQNGLEEFAYLSSIKVNKELVKQVKKYGKYVIQIGRIFPIKNIETSIKSMSLVRSDINLVIIGPIADSDYYLKLKLLITQNKLENRVFFVGVHSGRDKYYLIKNSIMMVHMAIWESFCNVVNEAMSQGRVCIVANNTALKYLVKENINGYRIGTHNYKELAEKINTVSTDLNKPYIKKIQKNNYNLSRSFSWVEVSKYVEQMFLSITI
jgi:glycosyltransferase involved in cell wall biosynthesis